MDFKYKIIKGVGIMRLTLDQHIYGKTKDKDFSTLAVSRKINKEDLKILEKYSLYKLPDPLLYEAGTIKPKKYLYYKLNDESIVIGRGIDIGRDEFGRVGNFIFHNIIFKINELENLNLTPITLIQYLEENNIFLSEPFYENQISPIELDIPDKYQEEEPKLNIFENKIDLLYILLYACFNTKEIPAPIYITGDENKIFEFLDNLLSILPKWLQFNLSFNTLWYNDPKLPGLFICCTSLEGIKPQDYSLKIELLANSYDNKIKTLDNVKYNFAKLIADKALSDKQTLSMLYSLQELLRANNWGNFIELYKNLPQDIKKLLYDYNKENILEEISNGNVELFAILREVISDADRDRVFRSKTLINNIFEHNDETLINDYVIWFYNLQTFPDFYFPMNDSRFLNSLLGRVKEEKEKFDKDVEIIKGLIENYIEKKDTEGYDESIEEKILSTLLELLESENRVDTTKILKTLTKLPPATNPKIILIRTLVRYKLGDIESLISLIKKSEYQSLLYEILNEGAKVIDWDKYKKLTFKNRPKKPWIFK
jgi:hypothetical protein